MLNAMERGAEVFKNISCVGKYDIVLSIDDSVIGCDVKQKRWNTNANDYTYRGGSKSEHVILVHPVTKEITWHREPKGWEGFWK